MASSSSSSSSSGSADAVKKKPRENLEHYFPSGVKRSRPLHNLGEEFAVRSHHGTEYMGYSTGSGGKEDERDGVRMDPSVWGLLPDDLHARVLEKLPLQTLGRCRSVCKRWNAIILSVGFYFSRQDSKRKCVPLYFNDGVPSIVYNKKRNSWQEISFSFLDTPSNLLSLLVSAGGLLCLKTGIAGELLVCNPVKKQSRRLQVPCRILHDSISVVPQRVEAVYENGGCTTRLLVCHVSTLDKEGVVGMSMDREGRNYKLVVAGLALSGGSAERGTLVYDSSTDSWTRGGDVPKGLRFWRTGKPVASKGFVYFICCNKYSWMDDWGPAMVYCNLTRRFQNLRPWFVARYDVENGKWRIIPVARGSGILIQLVEYQGRILIVQRLARDQTQMFTSELREDGRVMPFVATRMPVELFPHSIDVMVGDWCVGQGDQFYVAGVYPENDHCPYNDGGFFYPRVEMEKWLGFGVLSHNPVDKTWTQLPDLCGKYYPEGLYAFEPSLADV